MGGLVPRRKILVRCRTVAEKAVDVADGSRGRAVCYEDSVEMND